MSNNKAEKITLVKQGIDVIRGSNTVEVKLNGNIIAKISVKTSEDKKYTYVNFVDGFPEFTWNDFVGLLSVLFGLDAVQNWWFEENGPSTRVSFFNRKHVVDGETTVIFKIKDGVSIPVEYFNIDIIIRALTTVFTFYEQNEKRVDFADRVTNVCITPADQSKGNNVCYITETSFPFHEIKKSWIYKTPNGRHFLKYVGDNFDLFKTLDKNKFKLNSDKGTTVSFLEKDLDTLLKFIKEGPFYVPTPVLAVPVSVPMEEVAVSVSVPMEEVAVPVSVPMEEVAVPVPDNTPPEKQITHIVKKTEPAVVVIQEEEFPTLQSTFPSVSESASEVGVVVHPSVNNDSSTNEVSTSSSEEKFPENTLSVPVPYIGSFNILPCIFSNGKYIPIGLNHEGRAFVTGPDGEEIQAQVFFCLENTKGVLALVPEILLV